MRLGGPVVAADDAEEDEEEDDKEDDEDEEEEDEEEDDRDEEEAEGEEEGMSSDFQIANSPASGHERWHGVTRAARQWRAMTQ